MPCSGSAALHRTDDPNFRQDLARFVTAATALHPRPHNSYTAGDVHRWLARLAAYLSPSPVVGLPAGTGAGPHTDLVLHQLWPLAGPRRVRAIDAALTALVVLLPALLAWAIGIPLTVPVLLFVMLAFTAGLSGAKPGVPPPARVHWANLLTKSGYRRFVFGLLMVLASMLLIWLPPEYQHWYVPPVAFGALWGVGYGLATLEREPPISARPRDVIRSDLLLGLAEVLASGTALGVTSWFLVSAGLADALLVGLTGGLTIGSLFGAQSGRRYLAFVLSSKGGVPMRLGAFLDWACAAGLLRLAGSAYQFRHRELQQWLARHPEMPPV